MQERYAYLSGQSWYILSFWKVVHDVLILLCKLEDIHRCQGIELRCKDVGDVRNSNGLLTSSHDVLHKVDIDSLVVRQVLAAVNSQEATYN